MVRTLSDLTHRHIVRYLASASPASGPAPTQTLNWQRFAEVSAVLGVVALVGLIGTVVLVNRAGTSYADIKKIALDPEHSPQEVKDNAKRIFDTNRRAFRKFNNCFFFRRQYARVIGLVAFAKANGCISANDEDYWRSKLRDHFDRQRNAFPAYIRECKRVCAFNQARTVIKFAQEVNHIPDQEGIAELASIDTCERAYQTKRRRLGDWTRLAHRRDDSRSASVPADIEMGRTPNVVVDSIADGDQHTSTVFNTPRSVTPTSGVHTPNVGPPGGVHDGRSPLRFPAATLADDREVQRARTEEARSWWKGPSWWGGY